MNELTAHVKETVRIAYNNGVESFKLLGKGWMEESIKIDIAHRAAHQDFISFDDYVLVAMDMLRRVLEKAVA